MTTMADQSCGKAPLRMRLHFPFAEPCTAFGHNIINPKILPHISVLGLQVYFM